MVAPRQVQATQEWVVPAHMMGSRLNRSLAAVGALPQIRS